MDAFQRNTIRAFRKVKEDIRNLQAQVTDLCNRLDELSCSAREIGGKKKR